MPFPWPRILLFSSMLKYAFIFLFTLKVFSQNNTIDSLKGIFNSKLHDTTRLSAISNLINYVSQTEAAEYSNRMLELAEQDLKKTERGSLLHQKYLKHVVEGYFLKGVFTANRSQHDSALLLFDKAILMDVTQQNWEILANCELSKANIYITRGSYTMATKILYKALKHAEKAKNFELMGRLYFQIGRLYFAQSDYKKCIEFDEKAYTHSKKANSVADMIEILNDMSQASYYLKNNSEAIAYANKSIKLCLEKGLDYMTNRQMYYSNLALIAWINKDYKEVITYYEKSIEIAKASNNTSLLGSRHINIAQAYYYEHNYPKAISNANIAMDIAIETKNVYDQRHIAEFLTLFYETTKDYKQALKYNKLTEKLDDSLEKIEYKKIALEQHLKYEYEKKELISKTNHEKEILKLSLESERQNDRKNISIFVLLACFVVSVITAYFLYKNQKQKNTIAVQSADLLRQKMLLSQMNPHFVFNSINSIQSFILDRKEKEAYSYLAKFSKLIRMVLNNTEQLIIPLFQEIDLLKTYVELEQLRFESVFVFELVIDDGLEEQSLYVPPMLIQPYVENAIWHGLMNLNNEREGKLTVWFGIENGLLKIIVEDNGIGRTRAGLFERDAIHKPVAMKLTEKRLQMINKAWGQNEIKVMVHDLYNDRKQAIGTKVELYLPLDFQENERI